jgi:uncharacterized membrane protein YjdF
MSHTFTRAEKWIGFFTFAYLFAAGAYFARDFNLEFVIYVGVIVAILGFIFATLAVTRFPAYLLALVSIWGLMHVLGGGLPVDGGVLFGWRIYPFLDYGGEFYVLKYDQVVHFYLYGVVALMFHHLLRTIFMVRAQTLLVAIVAIMASLGVSAMNEIMEFLIAVTIERNGVGGYHNAMLDLIFNFSGALLAVGGYELVGKLKSGR